MATLASLISAETKAQIYARGLALAEFLGVTTTSWVVGDPTRSLYHFLSEVLEILEISVAGFFGSAFLDYAEGDWLTIVAKQVFNVDRVEATYASTTITLTNGGGGLYVLEAGDSVFRDTSTGKTYTSTSGGTLASGVGQTLSLDITADEAGSDSSAGAGDIDDLVTTLLLVTCTNATAAVGLDEESDASLRDRCRAKLGMLSPNGPATAYDFVVRDSTLTGVSDITRSRTLSDSATGDVITYVAGASGSVAGASVTAAQAAVERWATPLCITPEVRNSGNVTIDIEYDAWIYDSVGEETADIEAKVVTDLAAMFAARPIGGDVIAPATEGKIYVSLIEATIKASYPNHTFRVRVDGADTDLTLDDVAAQVAVLGNVTANLHFEAAP